METLFKDVRHALRLFVQTRAFSLTALLALALGIGSNTAIFSLVNTVLLKEPPFPGANRIVILETKTPQGGFQAGSPAKFAHWAQQKDVLEDVSAFAGGVLNWTGGQTPRQLRSERVSSGYFRLFGVPMLMGDRSMPRRIRRMRLLRLSSAKVFGRAISPAIPTFSGRR
jgi:putative ABC transport system permease protein